MKTQLVLEEETYQVIGACIKVHKNLGNGFPEEVYQEALVKELSEAAIPFEQEKKLSIYYNGAKLNKYVMADFVCFQKILIDVKCLNFINTNVKRQAVNFLKSTNLEVGLLINFGENSLTWKRIIHTPLE